MPLPLPLPLVLPQTPPPLAPCSRVRFECWVSGMRRLENVNMNCINLPGRHSLPLRLNPIVAQPLGKLSRQRLYGFSASYSALTRSKCKRTKKYQAARWRWSESLLVLVLVVHSKKLGWQWAGFRECFPNFVLLFLPTYSVTWPYIYWSIIPLLFLDFWYWYWYLLKVLSTFFRSAQHTYSWAGRLRYMAIGSWSANANRMWRHQSSAHLLTRRWWPGMGDFGGAEGL